MQHQIVTAVGTLVHVALRHLDAAEVHAGKIAQELVVIAGDVDDAGALAGLAQKLLDDVVAVLRPVPAALQPPAVDDVADQHDRLRFVMPQEIEQEVRLGGLRPEMDVGDEQRPELSYGVVLLRRHASLVSSYASCPRENQTRVSGR
ncbi:hypothetical protein D9M72_529740 [compost metagenome]